MEVIYLYLEYSDWSRLLAKNYTEQELKRKLIKCEGRRKPYANSHSRAIQKTTSMQSNSQRRAQCRNKVVSNYEEFKAIQDALEIHKYYPEMTKQK